jgi:hypothetical protein
MVIGVKNVEINSTGSRRDNCLKAAFNNWLSEEKMRWMCAWHPGFDYAPKSKYCKKAGYKCSLVHKICITSQEVLSNPNFVNANSNSDFDFL